MLKSAAVLERPRALPAASPCEASAKAKPRERIVATAIELFHQQGLRVGVEAIAEAAGTNKMTLYRHFGSKDELIVECLHAVSAEWDARWRALAALHLDAPRAHLLAWVAEKSDYVLNDCRGCTLINAAVEIPDADHPARRYIEQCKVSYRAKLVALCAAAGAAEAEELADALSLLLEGARVTRLSGGMDDPHTKFVRSAERMIAAFTAPHGGVGGR